MFLKEEAIVKSVFYFYTGCKGVRRSTDNLFYSKQVNGKVISKSKQIISVHILPIYYYHSSLYQNQNLCEASTLFLLV